MSHRFDHEGRAVQNQQLYPNLFVLLMLQDLRSTRNLYDQTKHLRLEIPPAKARRAPSSDNYFLCGLCVFAGDIPNLRLRLCRARTLVVRKSFVEYP
jgi:hypothetical protein